MLTKKTLIPFLFVIIILSAYSPMPATRRAAAQSIYPVISVTPQSSIAAVGETINVSIVISNAVDLFLYQVFVSYSPKVLNVTRVTEGDLLKRSGAYPTFMRAVYTTEGLVQVVGSLFNGAQTVTGSGEAFIVTFTVNKPGGSELLLHDVALFNAYRGQQEPILTENGAISTAAVRVTPNLIRPNESNDYSINKTFNVNITLEGAVSEAYSYDLNVTYGKDVLEATAATLLPLMGTPNANFTLIDNDNGTLRLSLECSPPAPSTNVTGALATITFQVVSLGETNIEFSGNSTLIDESGNEVFPLLGSASFNNQYANRNIGIISSSLSVYKVMAGDNITETAIVRNYGSLNETNEIVVSAYDAQNNVTALVAGPTTFTILANTTVNLNMTLATVGLGGNYTVQALIFYLPEETDYQDNEYTITQQLLVQPAAEESPSLFSPLFYAAVAAMVIVIAIVAGYILRRRRKRKAS